MTFGGTSFLVGGPDALQNGWHPFVGSENVSLYKRVARLLGQYQAKKKEDPHPCRAAGFSDVKDCEKGDRNEP